MTNQEAETKPADQHAQPSLFERVVNALQKPVDGSSLAVLRIAFGAIMLYEVIYYWRGIEGLYITPKLNFAYEWFPFVQPLPGNGLYYFFFVTGLASLGVAMGAWYRISAPVAWLCYTYWFLLDQTEYLNHFYLVCLLAFLLVFCSANRWASIDAWRHRDALPTEVPFWNLALLRGQLVAVYFFGGVAKLNADWLQGHPLHDWLARRVDIAVLGSLFEHDWIRTYFFAYGGLIFDLLIGPALLWKKTRSWALIPLLAFHLMNAHTFSIGIFPWLAIASTVVFFEPGLPRRVWQRVRARLTRGKPEPSGAVRPLPIPAPALAKASTGLVLAWFVVQIALPLRHFLYGGTVHWTEEGHRFAWHMKLRDKKGWITFVVKDRDSNQVWVPKLAEELTLKQLAKVSSRPYLIHQFAKHLSQQALARGFHSPDVRAYSWASLNGRPYQPLVSPNVDLSSVDYPLFSSASWIVPLDEGTEPGHYELFDPKRALASIRDHSIAAGL